MTEHTPVIAQFPAEAGPMPLKLRIDDYDLLWKSGAFADYSRTELIDGEIWLMNAQHRPHALIKMELYDRLRDAIGALGLPLRALTEATVAMPPHSAPDPDIVLTSEPSGEGYIPLSSVALIVEVADTSLEQDLSRKRSLYAQQAVPEYWVADVRGRVITRFWQPASGEFQRIDPLPFGSRLRSMTIAGLEIDTDFPR